MKGSIRVLLGLILVFGGVGGIENAEVDFAYDSLAIAIVGLCLMAWGVHTINK